MQLRVECIGLPASSQPCLLCEQPFHMKEGRVIVCDDHGQGYGDICPQCIGRGFYWISQQFEQLIKQVKQPYKINRSLQKPSRDNLSRTLDNFLMTEVSAESSAEASMENLASERSERKRSDSAVTPR